MTWLHFLNDCDEIDKMLNASIKSLSTEPFAKFAVEHDILLANVMFRL